MTAIKKERASPDTWENISLEEISKDISYGYTASSTDEPVGPKMLRITDIQDNSVNWNSVPFCKIDDKEKGKYLLKPNDIVFARTGATVGKSFLIPSNVDNSIYASYLIRVRLQDEIEPKYIAYFFQSGNYWSQIRENQAGIGQPNVNGSKLKKLQIPLAPLEQQKRIVAKIEELFSHIDAGIDALKKAKQLLKQYRQSVLKAAVTGELTKEWREANKDKLEPASQLLERILKERRQKWEEQQLEEFTAKGKVLKDEKWKEKYTESQVPEWEGMSELVESWTWVTIEQIASDEARSIQSGPFGSNLKHSEFQNEGKLVVGIDNVREGFFSMGSENRISDKKFKELEKYAARPGDVLITVMATIGRTCVIPDDLEPAIITKHIYRITIEKSLADPHYVNMYLWGAKDAREQFFGQTIGQTRPGLNGGIIKRVCLPLPPLEEQKLILEAVNEKDIAISRLESSIEQQMRKSDKNKQSILASAFSGNLI